MNGKEIPGALIADGSNVINTLVKANFEALNLTAIAIEIGEKPPSASRILDNLIAVGWVEKTNDKKYQLTDFFAWIGQRRMEVQRQKIRKDMQRAAYYLKLKQDERFKSLEEVNPNDQETE